LGPSERGHGLLGVHKLRTPSGRDGVRVERARGGHGDRDCGRRGREGCRTAGEALRGHDPHPYLRGSPGPLRAYRCAHPLPANVLVRLDRRSIGR
ncbi:unnamed protein product, partial [Ectocarpus sp. 8 AP-2014]